MEIAFKGAFESIYPRQHSGVEGRGPCVVESLLTVFLVFTVTSENPLWQNLSGLSILSLFKLQKPSLFKLLEDPTVGLCIGPCEDP